MYNVRFQSTPSVKRVTRFAYKQKKYKEISIHTLCEEGDCTTALILSIKGYFNPHHLWRGWLLIVLTVKELKKFQSTPSVKRVTKIANSNLKKIAISIHTLCEEGDDLSKGCFNGSVPISIHTLCEEGDINYCINDVVILQISIHTLCEEGDP